MKGIKNKGLGITEARIFSKMKNGFRSRIRRKNETLSRTDFVGGLTFSCLF